ncbi:MAG: histone deacetylase [Candidatus Poribacteria bacterium]
MIFIYSDKVYADIGEHVFPIHKYRLIRRKLIEEGIVSEDEFLNPELATKDDLLLVHTREYVNDFMGLKWTHRTERSELPLTADIRTSYLAGTGGTILACQKALETKIAVNIGGGFHHAFPDHAEGFCYTNDIAIAVRKLQKENNVKRFFIVDCDLHQGNGTAFIFKNDDNVFTFSIHQENNYPIKQKSDLDIGLADRTGDAVYLAYLKKNFLKIADNFAPEFVIYLAGADPYKYDQLGGLSLTIEGLRERDEFVISECVKRKMPLGILLAGGYAIDTNDTVTIHFNTCKLAYDYWKSLSR